MAENDDSWEKLPSELPHEVTMELFVPNYGLASFSDCFPW